MTTAIGVIMNAPLAATHHTPAPDFTVATALRWLGHHCAQQCSSPLDDLPAAIWFVRRRRHARLRETILVIDPTTSREPVARTHRLIRDINLCTRGDGIHVLGRRTADIANALSIVTRDAAALGGCRLQVAVQQPITNDRAVSDLDTLPGPRKVQLKGSQTARLVPTGPRRVAETRHGTGGPISETHQP